MGEANLALIGHGNWDGSSRFTIPANIRLGFFYEPESRTSLCFNANQIPGLCQQNPPFIRAGGQISPNFTITGGVFQPGTPGGDAGLRDCATGTVYTPISAQQVFNLSDIVASVSQQAGASGSSAMIRMLVCGGGVAMLNPVSGLVLPEKEAIQEMNRRNGEQAYQVAMSYNMGHAWAKDYAEAIAAGQSEQQAQAYAISNSRRGGFRRPRRGRKGTKRIAGRRKKTLRVR